MRRESVQGRQLCALAPELYWQLLQWCSILFNATGHPPLAPVLLSLAASFGHGQPGSQQAPRPRTPRVPEGRAYLCPALCTNPAHRVGAMQKSGIHLAQVDDAIDKFIGSFPGPTGLLQALSNSLRRR